MHKVGDFVPQGTLLVSGVSEDTYGHVLLHHAMGEIIGVYEETVTFSEPYSAAEYLPTGNTSKKRYLKLFSLKIPLFAGRDKYESADTETSESSLQFFGKELPLGFIKEDISETELTERLRTDEELEARIMQKIYLYEKNFIGEDTKIVERNIITAKNDTEMTYTVTYKLEGNIAEQKEIFVKQDKA